MGWKTKLHVHAEAVMTTFKKSNVPKLAKDLPASASRIEDANEGLKLQPVSNCNSLKV